MSKDDMPTEVTSTVLPGTLLRRLAVAVGLVGVEGGAVAKGAPWWLVPALAVGAAALWWVAVIFVTAMASRAATDGRDDWEDLFWPSMLRLLSQSRYAQVRDLCVHKKKPDEGEEK
jgi:hypothetical protein